MPHTSSTRPIATACTAIRHGVIVNEHGALMADGIVLSIAKPAIMSQPREG